MANQDTGFDYPGYDYAAQRTKISRSRALLDALRQQGSEPLQTNRMAGGYVVPISPFEGLANMAKTAVGVYGEKDLEKQQTDLATKAQGDYRTALATALKGSGLEQGEIDSLTAAGSNPMAANLMPFITGIAQQKRQMKMLQDWLGGGHVPGGAASQAPAGGPQVGAGTVLAPGMSGAPQDAAPGGLGGGMGNIPVGGRNVLGGAMLGMPGLTELGKMQFEQSKPIVQREGGLTDWQGNQITPPLPKAPEGFGLNRTPSGYELYSLPGAQAVPGFKGQEAGAVERARTENSLHPVTRASGAVVPTPGSALMPPQVPPQGIPIQPQGARPIPIQDAPQSLAIPDQQQPIVRPIQPQGAAPQGTPLAPQKVGTRALGDPWSTMPKIQEPQGIGQSTYQKDLAGNMANASKELNTKYGEMAAQANQRKAFNDQALSLVDKADVGPGSDFMTNAKSTLVERFGIPESSFANTPSANIVLNKDLKNAALQKGKQLFGARFTQGETGIMLNQAAPSATQTRTAIKFLLNTDNAQLDYQLQQANDLNRYLQQGGDPNKFDSWYAKAFPMSKAIAGMHTGGGTATQTLQWSDLK